MSSGPQKATTSPTLNTRPSTAIQEGADRLLELVELEKKHIVHLYHGALKGLEARQKRSQDEHRVQMRNADHKLEEQEKIIQGLTNDLAQIKSHASGVTENLHAFMAEHEQLMAALHQAGLVYVDGRLQFNDKTSCIVDEFVKAAKIQQDALSSSPLGAHNSSKYEDTLSGPVGPGEFFDVLAGVIEKGRKFAENLERVQRLGNKPHTLENVTLQKQEFTDLKTSHDSSNMRIHAH